MPKNKAKIINRGGRNILLDGNIVIPKARLAEKIAEAAARIEKYKATAKELKKDAKLDLTATGRKLIDGMIAATEKREARAADKKAELRALHDEIDD